MNYTIQDIEGIGATYGEKLAAAGIKTTGDFLTHCRDKAGRAKMSAKTGMSEKLLLTWANRADLMRISGVGPQFAELLEASGVDTVKELKHRVSENLATKLAEVNAEKKLAKTTPVATMVTAWVEAAKTMEPTITH